IPPMRIPVRRLRSRATVQGIAIDQTAFHAAPHLDAFMRKAMSKSPKQRFSSGREMADAFETAARADGVWEEPREVESLFEPLAYPIIELHGADEQPQRF